MIRERVHRAGLWTLVAILASILIYTLAMAWFTDWRLGLAMILFVALCATVMLTAP